MRYCYHVAGAVGVMMAVVMGVDPADEDTLDRACDLGLAFQLANIARDIDEDAAAGRCYLPGQWLAEVGITPDRLGQPGVHAALVPLTTRLAALAHEHEQAARLGAARLRFRQRWAVLSAAGIYGAIARKVAGAGAGAWRNRQTTSSAEKLGHVFNGFWQALSPPPALQELPRWGRRELARLAGNPVPASTILG